MAGILDENRQSVPYRLFGRDSTGVDVSCNAVRNRLKKQPITRQPGQCLVSDSDSSSGKERVDMLHRSPPQNTKPAWGRPSSRIALISLLPSFVRLSFDVASWTENFNTTFIVEEFL
jgi:hypothetical protein